MAHGTPDWGLVGPKSITYGLDDLGEAAVRMGSPHLWDRRGDVLYCTDFREGLGIMAYSLAGTGAGVLLVTGHSRHGAYCVNLRAGSDDGLGASIFCELPFQDPSCVGLEFSFSLDGDTHEMQARVSWWDGAMSHHAGLAYDYLAQELRYLNVGAGWTVLAAGLPRHICTHPEHTAKLVVDMELGEYVRLLLDELAYDLRGIPVGAGFLAFPPYWHFSIAHYGVALQNPDSYIDDVIITQNEPR